MSRSLQIRCSSVAISKQKGGRNINRKNFETCLSLKLNIALVMALCVCVWESERERERELSLTSVHHRAAGTASWLAEVCSLLRYSIPLTPYKKKKKISMECFSWTSTEEKEVILYTFHSLEIHARFLHIQYSIWSFHWLTTQCHKRTLALVSCINR